MGHRIHLILILLLTTTVYICHGCQMEGVIQWPVPVSVTIYDTHRGVVLNRSTSDIEGINSINMGDGLNAGPYLETSYSNSQFLMWTNDAFERYEENEVEESMSMTVNFRCTGGTTRTLVFWISVIDTNNNAPQFLPSDALEFTITTPVPPRFLVTGCFNDITVRDIDLTTQRIDFGIEENPYFEIEYDASLSSTPKEFKAVLRTTTLIRTLPEPIVLRISATDVDLTGDPPITTYGTVRVSSDTEFQFPEEPIFSQIFYLAEYNNDHTLVHEQISLRQGYDEQVRFSLEGDYLENFQLITNGNNLLITVRTPLNATTLMEQHILLIVTAEREYTSGGATTVVIQLPEVTSLEFESPHYNGSIVNNNLQLSNLILSQGYQDSVSVTILSEYASYFNAVVQGNIITVTMIPLSENIILENNFIHLQVLASTDRSSDTTIVTLEIIKDDNDTPVLNRGIYTGNYDSVVGLTVEPIYFVQGFDEYVSVSASGDHSQYFQIIQDGPNVIISSSVLPPEMYSEHHLLLSIEATKPRTVGANAAVVIYLPAARVLDFEAPNYKGTLQDNILTIETILLSVGYDDNVNFNLTGDYASFFTVSNIQNRVTLNLLTSLPDSIISENNLLLFTLNAFGLNAITTSTNIVLEIIKEDATTPLFNQNIYFGDYIGSTNIRIENINLRQGYDEGVSFRIEGEHSHYFRISNTGNSVILSLQSEIPHDVIFNEKVLAFNILAEKAFTVGANAAVLIRFPVELTDSTVMRFARNTYVGTLQDEQLTVESIVLNEGYDSNTEFVITGEYVQYFAITRINNILTIIMINTLPIPIVEDNNFIVLEIEARRERAVSVSASVVIDIIKEDVVHPVFSKAYYRGVYANETGLQFEDEIYLISGHDDTVTYRLEGEFATLFSLEQNGSIFSLRLNNAIPQNIMDENNQLLFTVVADKPNAISGRSAISIELLREETDIVILSFAQNSYVGKLEDSVLQLPPIILLDNSHQADLTIVGEFASHFVLSQENNFIRISLIQNLTPEIIEENPFIVLNLIATYVNAVSGHTTIVIEIAKELELKIPVFSQPHYIGEYSEETGLIFNNIIQLSQGYGDGVTIALAGDDAQWFTLVESEQNNYRLIVRDGGITVQNRNHLIFSVVASTQESINIHAAVIISLTEYTDGMSLLGFERITYTGSIRNDVATLEPIILSGGYTTAVSFSMFGDLAQHFILTSVGPTVTIALRGAIPEESIPDNRIIVLEVQASAPQAVPAHTSVVFTVTADDDATPIVELVFAQTYYTGSYSEANGLTFGTPMSLSQGYNESVEFALVGDQAQWFGLVRNQNSVTLTLTSVIPAAVISNNNQLIFVVTAQREGGTDARATIVIELTDEEYTEGMSLLGFERITYTGSIRNDVATLEPIILSGGYTTAVSFSMFGDLAQHFILTSVGPTVTIALRGAIPEESIPDNRIIVLEVQASAPQAVPAHTSVVFTVTADDDATPIVELVFAQTYYTGSYSEANGLTFGTPMSLSQGYNESVEFALVGDQAQWFGLVRNQNSVTLTLTSVIPAAVISNNNQLIFVVTAQREGGTDARATIVIELTDEEYTEGTSLLGFERITYTGSIRNDVATLEPIILSGGYTTAVSFSMFGDLAQHFILTSVGPTVTIALRGAIPEESIPDNRIIVLEVQASAPQAVPAHTSVVFTVTADDDATPIVELVFAQTYYIGSYSEANGLTFGTPMSLSQGYNESVEFALVGDQAQWFGLVRNQNSVTLTLTSVIPAAVISNNNQLIFVVTAQREGGTDARATIVIELTDEEYTEGMSLLGFERITYTGSIRNDVATLEPIILSGGYTTAVSFSMFGDLAQHFILTSVGPTVTIALRGAIPEESIPDNRIIVLEVQASAPQAVPAHTSVVFTVTADDDATPIVELVFAQTYYTGSYSEANGLTFGTPMSLSQGYNESVEFALVGDQAQWFGLVRNQNSVTLTLTSVIPAAVISNNNQLIFVVTAQREGGTDARATIVIELTDEEYTEGMSLLGFERITYTGSIRNDVATLEPIILSGGYTTAVSFSMFGDLAQHFILTSVGPTVTIALRGAIPEESIPDNRIIVLEVQASAPQAVPAHTSVVFTVTADDDATPIVELVFAQTYYTGSYSEANGLTFGTPMSLSQGYNESVEFALVGDQAQWFGLVRNQNSVTLTLTSVIPAAVISNNNQLIFVVTAQREGGTDARATIVIELTDEEYTEGMSLLGFERITYTGSIRNDVATLEPIILSGGYTTAVSFSMFGDLAQHFILTSVGPTVMITLRGAIPEESIPDNRIIVLEVQASAPQAVPAHTSVVFTVTADDDATPIVELVFAQTYYTGSYSEANGLTFGTPMSLSQGYNESVEFALVGDQAQWFGLVRNQNSVTLTLTSVIPAAVISNNNQLIFVVTAQREGGTDARATIVIELTGEEYTEGMSLLGFERITYTGSIRNDVATLEPIILSGGYTTAVSFSMFGDLAQHFILTSVGPTVTIALRGAIPEESIPDNRIIVLEVQASAPQAVPAHTSVVFTVTADDDATPIVELVFAQTYYTGSYSEANGLTFGTPMSLSQGYNESVEFALVGDQAQWFGLVRNQNSVTLTLTSVIPAAVISNNNQLIFVVTAQREGGTDARATIVIELTDEEYTEGMSLLGFERITYTGSIRNDVATLEPIILSGGYTTAVSFSMFGDLAQHFILTSVGPTVMIALRGAIPEVSIPDNRIIVLEVQASAPQAVPAHTSVVFTVTADDDATPIVELVFAQTYYTGSYSEANGLTFGTPMSLSQGYNESVEFALVGDQAQWFGLVRNQNSVTLTLTSVIPAAVISNNNQLIFVVTAQREGGTDARATIVIELTDEEYTEGMSLLGFERITYTGSIRNDVATLEPIILSGGYTTAVSFSMFGDLAQHFILTSVGPTVMIALRGAIPEESIPDNRIIVLEVQASAPQAVPAHTSVVFTVTADDDATPIVELVFAQTYYTGSYSEANGLTFGTPMSLSQGYNESVEFALVGDQAQWFGLVRNQNSVTLTLTSVIPAAVISNNNQLIFVVTAQREGGTDARATIVIELTDEEYTEGMSLLGFERITYTGSIRNDVATLEPIILSGGYTTAVSFSMFGDLAQHFILTSVGPTVMIALRGAIPEESIPANRVIVLEVQASAPQAVPAHTSVVFTVTADDDATPIVELVFAQTYYTGSYSEANGLTFGTPMSLSQGYNESVEFALVGDQAQWFGLVRNQNSVTLTLTSVIPAAVISNNNQLIFVVTAQREGGTDARATIVIELTGEEYTEGMSLLGFERITYTGSIRNDVATLEPIILSGGYTTAVSFSMFGDLAQHFILTSVGPTVTIALRGAIPEESIPDNRIIVLEVQASAPQAVPAHTSVVFTVTADDDATPIVELVFAQTYYTGSYSEANGLTFGTPMSLSQGYNESVEFALVGDQAQWFGLVRNQNSVTLTLTSVIPAAVISNNNQLIFVVTAQREGGTDARATIVIELTDEEYTEGMSLLGFERITYTGSIRNDVATLEPIILSGGYTTAVSFSMFGDLAQHFILTSVGPTVMIALRGAIPEESIPDNRIIVLEVQASAPQAVPAHTSVVFTVTADDDATPIVELVFAQTYYTGSYSEANGLTFGTPMSLSQGYNESVEFALVGDQAQWFGLVRNQNSVTLTLTSVIPAAVISNNNQLIFVVTAQREGGTDARATIVIELTDEEYTEGMSLLGFERITYTGSIRNDVATLEPIILSGGYTTAVSFSMFGDLAQHFILTSVGPTVMIALRGAIPEESIPDNRIIVLEVQASAPQAVPAHTSVVFTVTADDDATPIVELVFAQTYYTGSYSEANGLTFGTPMSLSQGYNESVEFALVGDQAQWFGLVRNQNSVTLTLTSVIPAAVISNNNQLIFVVTAQREGGTDARATIVIELTDEEYTEGMSLLGFERITYTGSIRNDVATLEPIILSGGYTTAVSFSMFGDLAQHFILTSVGPTVMIALRGAIPEESIPANRVIVLEVQASAPQAVPAHTSVVFTVTADDDATPIVELVFAQTYYTGSYSEANGLTFGTPMSLSQGYDETVEFALVGDQAQWFGLVRNENSVTLTLTSVIPADIISNNDHLIFIVTAQRNIDAVAQTIVVISLIDTQVESDVRFENVLYEGGIQNNIVRHESIVVLGFTGANIELYGEYANMFTSSLNDGMVSIQMSASVNLPDDIVHIVLEMHAATARAVLLLNVVSSDVPIIPSVTFSSSSYSLHVDVTQTGLVGHVHATADNGESVRYSIQSDSAHLLERISINNAGELHLSAPVNSGVYTFQVVATTVFTQATATATVQLTVQSVTICGDDIVVPPLIVLDRDEEEPHNNLVVLNTTQYPNCQYVLTNRWPTEQSWLYVDENGLHTRAIDREHESIAFMALSQVQVELNLQCYNDRTRSKRSTSNRPEWLGPYDYGTSNWILSDSITYNSRRSFVNLIVNDINDNAPVFVGKENEPIAVGYPILEIEERVMPRSLAELQATDADVGINAALLYWSSATELAVAPSTGFVHVRDGAQLEQDARFTVHATDRNGEGLTGSIELIVKLLDINNILVVTVSDAFLDDEQTILTELSKAVGYDVKVLRSTVTSQSFQSDETRNSRKIRETGATGASLQLYIYGIIERVPVSVDRLAADVNNNVIIAVSIVSTVSLEDHLEGQEICVIPGRDTGLLVATIILSIILFILIVLIIVWFILSRRKKENYEQFSDQNSLASRNESLGQLPKPDNLSKPRLNIEDLKKSERRLQEMLDAPLEEVIPHSSRAEGPFESILDIPTTEPHAPIVIQSIDKLKDATDESEDDEFGETNKARRKSVVTFNENVEKIIHVEDNDEPSIHPGYEGSSTQ